MDRIPHLHAWRTASALAAAVLAFAAPQADALVVPNQVGAYGAGYVTLPSGVAFEPNGDAFVVSSGTNRIEKFTRGGVHLLGWGGTGSGPGQFLLAYGIACAPDGSLYVVDTNSSRVQRFSPAGAYLGEFGSPGAGNGQFANPRGVAVDGAGNVYVADTYNHRVQKLTATGTYLAQWGGFGADPGKLQYPQGIAVDTRGRVYVADTYNHRMQEFDGAGAVLHVWGGEGAGDGQFEFPAAVQVDLGNNVYVADDNNHRIQRFTSAGRFVSKWGSQGAADGQFVFPQGLGVDPRGDVHVADTNNHRVQVFRSRDMSGHESILSWGGPGGGNGQFSDVRGVAVSRDGYVYVADKNGCRMQKFTGFGAWVATWGASGSADGQFNGPTGVAVDTSGNVYVTDFGNSRVEVFSPAGAFLGKWGGPGAAAGQFSGIWDIAIDDANQVYVVDGNRVQKFTTGGTWLAAWSCPSAAGITTDHDGSVYVACTLDQVVRKFAPDGTLLLQWGSLGTNPGQFDHPADAVCDSAGYVYVCDANGRVQQFTPMGGYVTEWGSSGSAQDQLGAPQMMAADRAGSVYVSEFLNYRVQKFASPPELLAIADVPGDDGGYAKVTFTLSSAEAPSSGAGAVNYRIVRFETNPPIGTVLAFFPADGVTTSVVVPTATNATEAWLGLREIQVQVFMSVPGSGPLTSTNYGFATDDLPPPAPLPIAGAYSGGATHLHWHASPAGDFRYYQVHRATNAAFIPDTYLAAWLDTTFDDVGPAGRWYEVIAVDSTGNRSAPAVLAPDQTVDVPPAPAVALTLDLAGPNPARGGAVSVRLSLAGAESARLELYDVAGRLRWASAVSAGGARVLRLDAGRPLPPGLWFVRLTQGARTVVRRAVVLD